MLCYVMLCYVMLCYVMLCYVMLCYVMLCYVMLCYVMLCYVMLCYVIFIYPKSSENWSRSLLRVAARDWRDVISRKASSFSISSCFICFCRLLIFSISARSSASICLFSMVLMNSQMKQSQKGERKREGQNRK